jgi:hypothetical protein
MAGYKPLKISGNQTGLVQNREEFILPDDAYPVLQNAYVWRERILRKSGFQLLGRLQRNLVSVSINNRSSSGPATVTVALFTILGFSVSQPYASIVPGTTIINIAGVVNQTLTDVNGNGTLTISPAGIVDSAKLNYATGVLTLHYNSAFTSSPSTFTGSYYPGLPVMGIRIKELQNSANNETIFFDQMYAYNYNGTTFEEYIPGTTWNAHAGDVTAVDFFWSTNYWVSDSTNFTTENVKLFWETNNTGQFGADEDPPMITDGTTWISFNSGTWNQIDAGPTYLRNWLCNLPFRGRMVVFNTWEGPQTGASTQFSNRIRWSTIGNPFIAYDAGPPAKGSWRDDIRGQGGFLDIPTSEDIVSVGFVRDNLIIYCERSTWQLRYTGRSIAPFQIEKVNSELGTESTFSAIQFDTSLVGIGDKGIVECDSYKSERIDIKIPDFVYSLQNLNSGFSRIQGIRDFPNRLAFWTFPLAGAYDGAISSDNWIYPNIRLVYNYENDSWAIFTDTLTALGNYQEQSNRTWLNTPETWLECNFSWIDQPEGDPQISGGNQHGFIFILDEQTVNDPSLMITNITGNVTIPTLITSPNHNLVTGNVIQISGVIGAFSNLNGGIFGVAVQDSNTFLLYIYDPIDDSFSIAQLDPSQTYIGGGLIQMRENFIIQSKKFNLMDEGQSIQIGYIDVLMVSTQNGEISLNVFLDYNDLAGNASNALPNNAIDNGSSPAVPDTFFNSIIPTSSSALNSIGGTKFWQRVFCPTRANFITLQYTFSNAQLVTIPQQLSVQIDAQILWARRGGRLTQF